MSQSKTDNEALIRRLYDALENMDFQGYMDLMADDVEYHAAGNCPVSGIHKGKEDLARIGQITFRETNGTHRVKLQQIIANKSHVAVTDIWSATRNGKEIRMDNLLIYKVESGKVKEIREFLEDEIRHDEFWK